MAFDLGLIEDAYTAALSNPQHDLAEEKVRRLVLALVEQGEAVGRTRCSHAFGLDMKSAFDAWCCDSSWRLGLVDS